MKFRFTKFFEGKTMPKISQKNYPVVFNIIQQMNRKGISIDELSVLSGIIRDDLRGILENKKVIGPYEIACLAATLGVDVDALFQEPENC